MRTRISAALLALVILTLGTLASTSSAQAQCPTIQVFNNTGCDLALCLFDAAGNRACITIRAVGSPFTLAFTHPFTPLGVVSAAKNSYPFGANGCTPCITLPGAGVVSGCCAVVCYDSVNCVITVNSCPAPCLP